MTRGNYVTDPDTGEKVWTTNLELLEKLGKTPVWPTIDAKRLAPCGYCRRCAIHDDPAGCLTVEAYERELKAQGFTLEQMREAVKRVGDVPVENIDAALRFRAERPS